MAGEALVGLLGAGVVAYRPTPSSRRSRPHDVAPGCDSVVLALAAYLIYVPLSGRRDDEPP
jgi:hypothetical protein